MRRKPAASMPAPSLTAVTADTYTRGPAVFARAAFHQKPATDEIHVGHRSPAGHGYAR
jgi:hypothetical protein